MRRIPVIAGILLAVFSLGACRGVTGGQPEPIALEVPEHFPTPNLPEDNPLTAEKVELGRRLFYDVRLSGDETLSCGGCHIQAVSFTDGKPVSTGITGDLTPRGSMSLANVAYASRLTWANPLLGRLEHQAMIPMFGEEPVEMGLAGKEEELLERLEAVELYRDMFAAAWPGDGEITVARIVDAIASFERTLISGDAPYDRYVAGDKQALSPAQKRGMTLFFSERLECFHCHGGFNFSDSVDHDGVVDPEIAFHNTGLYNLDGGGAYPETNRGIMEITKDPSDMGRFKAPSLRNIAVTAPYMHDGSIATLDGVVDHYAAGGRTIESGPFEGEGALSPLKSEFVPGFILEPEERADLMAFFDALTDQAFLTNPAFADPWNE